MSFNRFAFIFVCGLLAGELASAQTNSNLSQSDKKFLTETEQGSNYELSIAKLATEKSTNPQVKQYAERIVSDHSKLDPQLKEFVSSHNLKDSSGMESDDSASLSKLQNLQGAAFNKQFVRDEVSINKEDKREEKKEIARTNNSALKQIVQKMEKADTTHERLAKNLNQSL